MIAQGSDAWFAARCGAITASRLGDLMARTKSGPSASRANLIAAIVAERLTGKPAESYSNAAMQWGVETEPLARSAYEAVTGEIVDLASYVPHPAIPFTGASPDGYVGEGLIEIKCPNTATHIEYLLGASIPGKYLLQMQWQMECTNRPWCDYVSFDPRMPEHLQMKIQRVERDPVEIARITEAVIEALEEIESTITKLESIK